MPHVSDYIFAVAESETYGEEATVAYVVRKEQWERSHRLEDDWSAADLAVLQPVFDALGLEREQEFCVTTDPCGPNPGLPGLTAKLKAAGLVHSKELQECIA